MEVQTEQPPSLGPKLLLGFEYWCENARRRLFKLLEIEERHPGKLGDYGYYRAANLVRQAWEFAVLLGAQDLIELCWPREAMKPLEALICMTWCARWCGNRGSLPVDKATQKDVMDRMDRFAKRFRRSRNGASSRQMTTSDPEKELLATVLSEYATKASAFPQDQQPSHRFELVGSIWHLRYGKETGDFPKSRFKGMAFIAKLLRSPYVRLSASDLDDQDRRSSSIRPASELDNGDAAQVDPSFQGMIDHDALLEYGAQLREIEQRLADRSTSVAEREQLVEERDAIAKVIKASRGLGGRLRELGSSPSARAVGRVRKALAAAYDAIERERMPEMARYLRTAIQRNKSHFVYLPQNPAPAWRIKTF